MEAFEKRANEVSDAKPVAVSTSVSQVKFCPDCQHSKLLVDFEKTITSVDGRTDVCRACLAAMRAKINQKELHHLGISVKETWERAKICSKCGLKKELRDFARDSKHQTRASCRACESALYDTRTRYAPLDQVQQCIVCGEVQAAEHFRLSPIHLSGRLPRVCQLAKVAIRKRFCS